MAAIILDNPRAVQMSVYVVRAFARLRQTVAAEAVGTTWITSTRCMISSSALTSLTRQPGLERTTK
jgi:hypothetical protein